MPSTNDLIRIAAAGGRLDLRNAQKSTDDLIRIAAAASSHGAKVWISGATKSADDLIRIGAAGRGCVFISF